jgi:hypothetical protein
VNGWGKILNRNVQIAKNAKSDQDLFTKSLVVQKTFYFLKNCLANLRSF